MTVLSATTTLEQTHDHDDNINTGSSILIAFDDEDEDSNDLILRKSTRNNKKASRSNHRRRVIIENDEVDDDDDSSDDNDNEDDDNDDTDFTVTKNDGSTKQQRRWKPPRPSTNAVRKSFAAKKAGTNNSRQRRRSSARFIRLSQQNSKRNLIHDSDNNTPQDGDDMDDTVNDCDTTTTHLSELYNKAIQMNVENKINAGNSWNLRLIENIDQFLFEHDVLEEGDEEEEDDIDDNVNDDTIEKGIDHNVIGTPQTMVMKQKGNASTNKKKRINFTKASCTLDASVKIYSYRVDDVHLTSYKVLANLNRSDNKDSNANKKNNSHHDNDMNTTTNSINHYNDDQNNDDDDSNGQKKKNTATKNSASTLETQIANININKLDSAFDIDPLFHKMSKSFDEGGAKGLLLHNLGVGTMGCNIVFDSTLDDDVVGDDSVEVKEVVNVNHVNDDSEGTIEEADGSVPQVTDGMIDISSLTTHLRQLLESQNETLESIPIVPQLESLRAEYASLEADGFIGDVGGIVTPLNQQRNKRRNQQFYEPDPEEEQEADRSIHQIALERTCRFSMTPAKHSRFMKSATTPTSLYGKYDNENHEDNCEDNADFDDDHHEGNAIDFGGHGEYENGDDDFDYPRLSTFSFQQVSSVTGANQEANNLATANLLDALSAGNMLLGQNASSSDYFNINDVLKDSTNVWAGAAHWKRNNSVIQSLTTTAKKKAANKTRITKKIPMAECNTFVPFHDITPDLTFLLEDNVSKEHITMAGKGRRTRNTKKKTTTSTQTIQLSKAMITKYTNNENLLPEDAGVQVAELSRFFLRPTNSFIPATDNSISNDRSSHPTQDIDYNSCNNANIDGVNGVGCNNKVVSFGDINGNGWDDDNDSFGGGDDGPGFELADHYDNDNFLLPTHELADVRKIEKIQVGYATVAKKVDVKRLKNDLWIELENKFGLSHDKEEEEEKEEISADINQTVDDDNDTDDIKDNNDVEDSTHHQNCDVKDDALESESTIISFQDIIRDLEQQKSQQDVTLPFYFICVLHLANEKCLKLTSSTTDGLNDFSIEPDFGMK